MTRQALRFYWQFYKGRWLPLLLTSCLLVLQPIVLTGTLYLIKRLFDEMLTAETMRPLVLMSLGLSLLYVFSGGLALFIRYRMMQLTHGSIQQLRHELTTRLYAFSRTAYTQFDRKQLQTVLVQDVIRVDVMTNAFAGRLLPSLMIVGSLIVVLAVLNLTLFLVTVGVFPLLLLIEYLFRPILRRHIQSHHRALEALQTKTLFGLEALDLTHDRSAEQDEITTQVGAGEHFRHVSTHLAIFRETLAFIQDALMLIVSVLCLTVGGWFIIQGHMSGSDLFVFYTVIVILRPYIRTSWTTIPQIIEGVESLKTLNNWLIQPDDTPQFGTQKIDFTGAIQFKDMHFAYSKEPLLSHINLQIAPAETVAIVGANGSGKSTLANLLLGYYAPQEGVISADNIPLTDLSIHALRQQIGIVPQNPLIFRGTIWENIVYGVSDVTRTGVVGAADLAQLTDLIETLPNGYETLIGDQGVLLSGGQRQRIALARAFVARPPFLILDEPTNHLDAEAVQQIMHGLRRLPHPPACLLITHDFALAAHWDKVYELRAGHLHLKTGATHKGQVR